MKIVIVEDNWDITLLWRMSFESDGAEVEIAHSVEQAKAEIDWSSVDAATVDVQLGAGDDGTVLIDWLDENFPHVCTAIVTALSADMLPEHMRSRVINKPTTIVELTEMLFGGTE